MWRPRPPSDVERGEIDKARWQLIAKKSQLVTAKCKAPTPADLFTAQPWSVDELIAAKTRLNNTKNKLDHLNLGWVALCAHEGHAAVLHACSCLCLLAP